MKNIQRIHDQSKVKTLVSIIAGAVGMAMTTHASTSSIDFESPYTPGYLNTSTFVANSAFNGQQGWSSSTSGGTGYITNSTSSGIYTGGQVMTGSSAAGGAYIGGNNTFVWGSATTISYDLLNVANEKVGVGGWTDLNSDGLFQQNEASAYGGINTSGIFTLRAAGFGSDNLTGVNAIVGDWYQITLTYDDALSSITMDVLNLTLGGVVVDLNGAEAGTSYTHVFAGGSGDVYTPVSGFDGLFARSTGLNAIDNIQIQAVPEPSALALAILGGLGVLVVGRRRV